MNETLKINNKIVRICSCAAIGLTAFLFLILSAASILQTCRIDPANPYAEIINFDGDLVLTNLALIGLTILGALFFLRKKVDIGRVNTKFIVGVMLLVTTLISLAWIHLVRSAASGDAMMLLNTARDAAQDRYASFFSSYDYYGNYSFYLYYPNRLGYVLFAEILFRIFGTESSDILFQIPNVIALDAMYIALVMITKKLFDRRSITNLTAIFLTVCLQPMFMTTFTYGLILGMALAVWSAYHAVRYIKENRWLNAVFSILLMAAAYLIESSYAVLLAAVCIALILHAVDKKKLLALGMAALMVVCSVGLQKAVIASYAARSGAELNRQISPTLSAYMGVSESGMAPGWYNGAAVETLRNSNMDLDAANKTASEGIKNRLDTLSKNCELFEFFKKKMLSQLNEPAFQSIWLSQVRKHDLPEGEALSSVAESVYTGGLSVVLDNWFNYYGMIVYLSFFAGMIWLIRKKKLCPEMIILPAAVFGGVLYHMIYEAKSQYLLPYFILLIPFAVYGLIESVKALRKKSDILFN